MKATWRYLELAAAFGNFTHEIAVRVSEDADNQWFPCSIIREDDTAGTVDVLATSNLILQTDFPATFIRNVETLTLSPAQGRINHGVDGLPIRPEFGGLDPYWSGVYIAHHMPSRLLPCRRHSVGFGDSHQEADQHTASYLGPRRPQYAM